MRKLIVILLAVSLTCLLGCNAEKTVKNQDDAAKIGFILETTTVERWQRDRDIFVARAKELGADVIVKNAHEDSELQKEIGMEMIEQGVDVLVIIVYDKNSLSDLVAHAHDKNVKVIAYDRMIRNANVDLYISFDNYKVGELIGKALTQAVPKGNYLLLNGSETDNNAFMLNEGCMNQIQPKIDNGDIKVVGETWVEAWRDEVSYEFTTQIMDQGYSIDAVFAANDRVAEGAVNALSENRLAGQVYVTGQDAELAACQRIVEGTQGMTVYKPINVLAEGAAEIAVKMASNQDIGEFETTSDGTYDINYLYYMPITVTKNNINETVIKDGFYTMEQIYVNVPRSEWPQGHY